MRFFMARPEPIIPVSAKMYRHFAMITLAITGSLAMFADGENRQEIKDHLARQKQITQNRAAEGRLAANGKGGNNNSNFLDNRTSKGRFGADPGVGYSKPRSRAARPAELDQSSPELEAGERIVLVEDGGNGAAHAAPPPGMTLEEYELMIRQKQGKKRKKSAPPAKQDEGYSAILAASKARSQTRSF